MGSAWLLPAQVSWCAWTPSMSASSKASTAVYQLTAVDVATRWAVVRLVVGDKSAAVAARFLTQVRAALRAVGAELTGVLTDNGPEFTGRAFTSRAVELGLTHHRIPPRSPNHNAVAERF
jgi:transposase InsO family protein